MSKTIGKYKVKSYQCKECGNELEIGTNHWGECYPVCKICDKITIHVCLEDLPEGFDKPEPWDIITLDRLVETI